MHTGFGFQPAVSIFAFEMNGGGFDAGHFTIGHFHQFGLEACTLAPAQVHAQQHAGPVLGFGAARAGLNVQVAVVGVHLAREHATEFQLGQFGVQLVEFGNDFVYGAFVVFFHRHVEQFFHVDDAGLEFLQGGDDLIQGDPLTAQVLGFFRGVPDGGVFQFAIDFVEAFALQIEVKDTP